MRLIWDALLANSFFLSRGIDRDFGPSQGLVAMSGGSPIGALIAHDYNPEAETIEASAVSAGPFQVRRMGRVFFGYAFDQIKCQAVIFRTSPDNLVVRKIGAFLGAKEYIIPRMRGRNAAEAVIVITDDAWKTSKWGCHEST